MSELDDDFMRQAREAEEAEKTRQANRGQSFTYDNVKYTGLEKRTKLIRFIGRQYDLNLGTTVPVFGKFDARVVRVAKLIADNGKGMRLILPLTERDETNHPILRLIQKVNEGEWVDTTAIDPKTGKLEINPKTSKVKKVKHFENAVKHPEIFAMVNRSGLDESDNRVKYGLEGKGWSGKDYFVANVIDRDLLAWHRENKHLVILSKNIGQGKPDANGKVSEYPEPGVPYFGFTMMLNDMIKYYGWWEKFDYGIKRTGLTNPAYEVFNANRNPERIQNPDLEKLLGDPNGLTEEEKTWEPYDLDKIFGVTSYTRIFNRLQKSLMKIDSALGTGFYKEIEALANQEAELRKANAEAEKQAQMEEEQEVKLEQQEERETTNAPVPMQESDDDEPVIRQPAPRPTPPVATPAVPEDIDPRDREQLPGWGKLKPSEKEKVLSAVKEGDTWNVTFSVKARGKCGVCQSRSPETFETCPQCGSSFGTF